MPSLLLLAWLAVAVRAGWLYFYNRHSMFSEAQPTY